MMWLALVGAILSEVTATLSLRASEGLRKKPWVVPLAVFYPLAFVLLTVSLDAGMAIGVIVPTSLALAGERLPGNAATLFGLLLTMAQVGGMLLPPLLGVVADLTSLRAALLLAVANTVVIATLAWRVR